MTRDFSCLGWILEEYMSFGITSIKVPASFAETNVLREMPLLLQNRLDVFDDSQERESVHRVLHGLRKAHDMRIRDDQDKLIFPKNSQLILRESVEDVHVNFKKIACGFNHGIFVDVDLAKLNSSLTYLRQNTLNADARSILAEFQGILSRYETLTFPSLQLTSKSHPSELVSLFDRLVNDPTYLEYSSGVMDLTLLSSRNEALSKLRGVVRRLAKVSGIAGLWDLTSKCISTLSGKPIPDSKLLVSVLNSRNLPGLVNMTEARTKAVTNWRESGTSGIPLNSNGKFESNKDIIWLPVAKSMQLTSGSARLNIGTIGEILEILMEYKTSLAEDENSQLNIMTNRLKSS